MTRLRAGDAALPWIVPALDPRLDAAFAAHAGRLRRIVVGQLAVVVVAVAAAAAVDHWALWLLAGVVAVGQTLSALVVLGITSVARSLRTRLEADVGELTWLHVLEVPGSPQQVLELHDRDDQAMVLVVTSAIAAGAVAAARALPSPPTVTTTAAERTAAAPRHRLAGKLRRLERAARASSSPRLVALAGGAGEAVAAWRALLFAAAGDPYREPLGAAAAGPPVESARWAELPRADLEARLDRLLRLYQAVTLDDRRRAAMAAALAAIRPAEMSAGVGDGARAIAEIEVELDGLRWFAARWYR